MPGVSPPRPRRSVMLAPQLLGLACLAASAAPPAANPATAAPVARFRAGGSVRAVAFSPDGKRLACLDDSGVGVYETATGKRTHEAEVFGGGTHLSFDGATLRWITGQSVWAWKPAD